MKLLPLFYTFCPGYPSLFCRGSHELEEYLKFVWAAAGLLSIHIYEPYLTLIIDLNTRQSELLKIFPNFYQEMLCPKTSFCQLKEPALKSIAIGWKSPYSKAFDEDIVRSLETYLETADEKLMDTHIHSVLQRFAVGFARQKGEAYGFGEQSEPSSKCGSLGSFSDT